MNTIYRLLAPVVQKVGSAINWINPYPVDNAISFRNTYPLDSDLSLRMEKKTRCIQYALLPHIRDFKQVLRKSLVEGEKSLPVTVPVNASSREFKTLRQLRR